jgi:hypothetical protein
MARNSLAAVVSPVRKEQAAIFAIRRQTVLAYKQIRRTWYAHTQLDKEMWSPLGAGLTSRPRGPNRGYSERPKAFTEGPQFVDSPDQWVKLIRKLRWIGMRKDAEVLEKALAMIPFADVESRRPVK